jgi:hypothetical protein
MAFANENRCATCHHYGEETFTGDCSCRCHDYPKRPTEMELKDSRIAQLERELAEARELARCGGWSK